VPAIRSRGRVRRTSMLATGEFELRTPDLSLAVIISETDPPHKQVCFGLVCTCEYILANDRWHIQVSNDTYDQCNCGKECE